MSGPIWTDAHDEALTEDMAKAWQGLGPEDMVTVPLGVLVDLREEIDRLRALVSPFAAAGVEPTEGSAIRVTRERDALKARVAALEAEVERLRPPPPPPPKCGHERCPYPATHGPDGEAIVCWGHAGDWPRVGPGALAADDGQLVDGDVEQGRDSALDGGHVGPVGQQEPDRGVRAGDVLDRGEPGPVLVGEGAEVVGRGIVGPGGAADGELQGAQSASNAGSVP